MEELTNIIFNCNFDEIKNQNFPKDKRFGLIVNKNGIKYEFLITLNSSSENLFVGASAALPRNYGRDRSKPYFERWSWEYDVSTIFFNDPTLYLDDNLIGGWGVGTPDDWYLENISKIIECIADTVKIPHCKIMIYGSSAGGFMALVLSTLIKDSTAIADIPQTILYNEPEKELWRWHWKELVKYCFNNLPEQYIINNFKHRLNILELIKKENYIPDAYLLCDCSVEKDFERYYVPFFNSLDELPFENNSNRIKLVIMGNNNGHLRLDKDENINLVNIVNGILVNKSQHLVDKIYQMPVNGQVCNNHANNILKSVYCLGSSATRDCFNNKINPNFNKYFKFLGTSSQISLISLMNQNQFEFTDNDININELTPFQIQVIEKELKKTGLNEILNLNFDYLILDNYFEIKFGICKVGEKIFTNNPWNLHNTLFFKNLENKKFLTIQQNTEEFFNLWCESCDLFFEFLSKYKPEVKVILNPVRNSTDFIKKNNSISSVDSETEKILNNENKFISMLDTYILTNFDVDVIIFDKVYKADENHLWNFSYINYEPGYYQEFIKKLNLIVERDNTLDYSSLVSKNIREIKKTLFLSKSSADILNLGGS